MSKPDNLTQGTRHRLHRWGVSICLTMVLLVTALCGGIRPVMADAGRFLAGTDYAELTAELSSLQGGDPAASKAALNPEQQQRLADLQALQRQISRSDDRAQLRNRTSHNLGVFARYKKDPADQAPGFYVLGPGHSTDDDFDLVAVLIPSGVSLRWGEAGEAAAISTGPRVIRVLEGQQLAVGEAAASAAAAPLSYQLSQPPFQVLDHWEPQPTLPEISQAALDQERETAPLD